ncbi:MAG: TetR/AcrR family transcriptional regulator [Anaerolineales bacterium]|nr:TetR/AcrR family transcriptional regulator [Anaerolineales bacterium]
MSEAKPELPRRERQSAARANQILDAAAALFAERGFHRTTTRDIAEAADVAEGTLYNYFANKDDLLIGVLQRLSESIETISAPMYQISTDARAYFTALLEVIQSVQEQNLVRILAILSEIMANAELRARFYSQLVDPGIQALERNLKPLTANGQIRQADTAGLARLLASFFIGLFFLELLGDPVVSNDRNRIDEVSLSVIFDGIIAKNQEDQSR